MLPRANSLPQESNLSEVKCLSKEKGGLPGGPLDPANSLMATPLLNLNSGQSQLSLYIDPETLNPKP